jgi:hypothetical protein
MTALIFQRRFAWYPLKIGLNDIVFIALTLRLTTIKPCASAPTEFLTEPMVTAVDYNIVCFYL